MATIQDPLRDGDELVNLPLTDLLEQHFGLGEGSYGATRSLFELDGTLGRPNLEVDPDDVPKDVPQSLAMEQYSYTTKTGNGKRIADDALEIDGTIVSNVALVLSQDETDYLDIPVLPVTLQGMSNGTKEAALVTGTLGLGSTWGTSATNERPLLVLRNGPEAKSAAGLHRLASMTSSTLFSTSTAKAQPPKKENKKDAKETKETKKKATVSELDEYVLSGDIKDFFDVTGLVGKLYSFQKKADEKAKKPDDSDEKAAPKDEKKGEEAGEKAKSTTDKKDGKQDAKKTDGEVKGKNKTDGEKKDEEKDGKKDKDKKDKEKEKKAPVWEKVVLNCDSEVFNKLSVLGTIFPSIKDSKWCELLVKNVVFTYTDDEADKFTPAGLRIEIDVILKEGHLKPIGNMIYERFGKKVETVKLKAWISKERDWKKAPEFSGLIFQGYVPNIDVAVWDKLMLKTVGVEISVLKEKKEKEKEEKDGKKDGKKDGEKDKGKKEEKDASRKKGSGSSAEPNKLEDESAMDVDEEIATPDQLEDATAGAVTGWSKQKDAKSGKGGKGENDAKDGKKAKRGKKEEDDEKAKKGEKKDEEEESKWQIGFSLFGDVELVNMPHANAPWNLMYRIGREYRKEKKTKNDGEYDLEGTKEDDKDKKEENKKEANKKEETKADAAGDGDEDAEEDTKRVSPRKRRQVAAKADEEPNSPTTAKKRKMAAPAAQAKGTENPNPLKRGANGDVAESDSKSVTKKPKTDGEEKEGEDEGKKTKNDHKEKSKDKDKDKGKDKDKDKAKEVPVWFLAIHSKEWKEIGGLKGMDLNNVKLEGWFEQGKFKKTWTFDLSGELTLAGGKVTVTGKFSKDENLLVGELKSVTWKKLMEFHSQCCGEELVVAESTEEEGNLFTFEEMKLRIEYSTKKKGITIEGKITWDADFGTGGKVKSADKTIASSNGKIEISTTGFEIKGDVKDFKIPNTDVVMKRAYFEVVIGSKTKTKKPKREISEEMTGTEGTYKPIKDVDMLDTEKPETEKPETEDSLIETREKKTEEVKDKVRNRETRFGIKGHVKYHNLEVLAGFRIERKKGSKKRDWILYGVLKSLKLRDLIPEAEDGFLDVDIRDVAIIASSKDMEKKKEEDKKKIKDKKESEEGSKPKKAAGEKGKEKGQDKQEKKTKADKSGALVKAGKSNKDEEGDEKEQKTKGEKKDEKKEEKDEDDEAIEFLDDLYALEKYPVKKGIQLCATIVKMEPVEALNSGGEVDGLILHLHYSGKKAKFTVHLPESCELYLQDNAKLYKTKAAIGLDPTLGGILLELNTTLAIDLDKEKLEFEGDVSVNAMGVDAWLVRRTPWKNPLGLCDKLTIAEIGGGFGVFYVPPYLGSLTLRGDVEIKDYFRGEIGATVSVNPAKQVLQVSAVDLDFHKFVRTLGEIMDISFLKEYAKKDIDIFFSSIYFYFSTGGSILDKEYPAGFSLDARFWLWDRQGSVELVADSDGFKLKGYVNSFDFGPLKVASASGDSDDLRVDIELTEARQNVFVDGMVELWGRSVKANINIPLDDESSKLKIDLEIKIQDDMSFKLEADGDLSKGQKIEEIKADFHATLDLNMRMFFEVAIANVINAIRNAGVGTLDAVEAALGKELKLAEAEIAKAEKTLERERMKAVQAAQEREEALEPLIEQENQEAEEFERAKRDYDENMAANNKAAADALKVIKNMEAKRKTIRDEAIREFSEKKKQLEKERAEEVAKLEDLEQQLHSETGYTGEKLKKVRKDLAERRKAEIASWKYVEDAQDMANKRWAEGNLIATTYWNAAVKARMADHEIFKLETAVALEAVNALETALNLPGIRDFRKLIDTALEAVDRVVSALAALIKEGPGAFIREFLRSRTEEIERKIEESKLIIESIDNQAWEYEQDIILLGSLVNQAESRVQRTRNKIVSIQEKYEIKGQENKLARLRKSFDVYRHNIDCLTASLDTVRTDFKVVMDKGSALVEMLGAFAFKIDRIEVWGSTETLSKGKGGELRFKFNGRILQRRQEIEVKWNPQNGISSLYKEAALQLPWG